MTAMLCMKMMISGTEFAVKGQGDWRRIMSIGFAALRLCGSVPFFALFYTFVGSNDMIQRLDYI